MAFATRCPKCRTIFQVVGTQLSQCAGMVRCSVCLAPFNGIEHLIGRIAADHVIPTDEPSAVTETLTVPAANQTAIETPSTPEEASPENPVPVKVATEPVSDRGTEPVDSGEVPSLTSIEKSLQEAFDRQLQSFSLEIDSPKAPAIENPPEVSPPIPDADSLEKKEPVLVDRTLPVPPAEVLSPVVPQKRLSFLGILLWFFIIAILLLAGSLAGIYYYGKEIVEEVPALTETVDTVCEQLSCPVETTPAAPPVTPESDLTLTYEAPVKDAVIPNAFNQKVILANTSRQRLPWPELTLEIMDTKGHSLSTRSLKPKDYLPDALSKTDGIEPATKHDLQLHFEFRHAPTVSSRVMISNLSTH